MKKALGKFLLILLAISFISSFIPATAFAKSGEDTDLKSIEVSCGVLDQIVKMNQRIKSI